MRAHRWAAGLALLLAGACWAGAAPQREFEARHFTGLTAKLITREDDASWRISGAAIERSAAMTYWEHEGSVRRFQKLMEKLGVDEALRKAGIQEGDTVHVGDYELEWQE